MIVNLDNPISLFESHLNKPDNKYILLSAPFGYGKTYFLNDFFTNRKEKYKTFWLSPVKYVVGQNEDIFEYIKTDIAIQLLACPELISENKPDFSEGSFLYQYILKNSREIATTILQVIDNIDIPDDFNTPEALLVKKGSKLLLQGLASIKSYEAWKKKLNKSFKSNRDDIYDFASKQDKVTGSIYEEDLITQSIQLALETIKIQHKVNTDYSDTEDIIDIENVLIIDDFDRLDPEHIFRILNILSVHRGSKDGEDKFGFDKLIIVCSIDNIRNIYKHKYGENVDFNGYMEKFYSSEIFHFNNQSAISYHCQSLFSEELNQDTIALLGILLSFFVETNKISIRSIIKYNKSYKVNAFDLGSFKIPAFSIHDPNAHIYSFFPSGSTNQKFTTGYGKYFNSKVNSFSIKSGDFPLFQIIPILTTIFGDYKHFREEISTLTNRHMSIPIDKTTIFLAAFLPIIHFISCWNNDKADDIIFSLGKGRYTLGSGQDVFEMQRPSSNVFGDSVSIPIKWDKDNLYNSSHSYYESTFENFPKNVNFSVYNSHLSKKTISSLVTILEFLEKKSLLDKIGITN
ncbi:hypothetical protein [Fibrella forsythiae]|uniref:KAP NTPase domain-containing protein n=1 Tax=Fibrella forsythiae TaxID=2817061 RepID=A0ABS3JNK5_9BACT|nr:hypothetical protein [Fibrella forsythiae]MBO0951574.1 hypothetical protein [Fibrella forsythiae]